MGTVVDIITAMEPYEEKIAIKAIMGYLDTAVPFLNLPIINQITEFLITRFVDLVIGRLNLFTINVATLINTGLQNENFKKAAEANLLAQTKGSDDDKKKAVEDLLSAARSFLKFTTP